MKLKRKVKKTWGAITSPKAKKTYAQIGRSVSKFGQRSAIYFERANRGIDRVVGTHNPNVGRLTGVALPKGYKIETIPKVIKGPRGYMVIEERQLVKIKKLPVLMTGDFQIGMNSII
jgi:hypothetical protein